MAWTGGQSHHEKRQWACKSWKIVDESICSLGLAAVYASPSKIVVDRGEFRYINTVGELKDECFRRLRNLPCFHEAFMRGTMPRDVPVLFAFSETIASSICAKQCPILVLPANASNDLRIPAVEALRVDEQDLDTLAEDHPERDWNRFPFPVALHMTKLSWLLRDTKNLELVLRESACVMLGPEQGFDLSEKTAGFCPHATTISAWQIRMDLVACLYQQEVLKQETAIVHRHLSADMSPQAGWHWLCAREESIVHDLDAVEAGNFKPKTWNSQRLTPSIIGLGESTATSIGAHLLRSLLHRAGPCIDKYRWQVKSWLSDQSKERLLNDLPARSIDLLTPHRKLSAVPADSDEYLFPDSLPILDHWHILYNALETGVKGVEWWSEYEVQLRSVTKFFKR